VAEVNLVTYLSYQAVMTTSESKLVYLLADVRPGPEIGSGPAALNLAIVLDKSGSMYAAQKLDYVINAVSHVIEQLRPNDLCALIAFADKARVLIPSSQIYDKNSARQMVRKIDQIDVGSGTEMLHGINAAVEEVRRNFSRDRMNHIILLTDGLTLHEARCKEKCILATEEGSLGFDHRGRRRFQREAPSGYRQLVSRNLLLHRHASGHPLHLRR